MKWRWSIGVGLLWSLASAALAVPPENQSKGEMPELQAAETMLSQLIPVIEANKVEQAAALFFPKDAFLELKAMAGAGNYHDQLVKWFQADITREHARLQGKTGWVLERFDKGRCVWKAPGTETNKIGYWSCYRSQFVVRQGETHVTIGLRAMINWGSQWYITHLGPIPKSP